MRKRTGLRKGVLRDQVQVLERLKQQIAQTRGLLDRYAASVSDRDAKPLYLV